jgi:hypothetical protein
MQVLIGLVAKRGNLIVQFIKKKREHRAGQARREAIEAIAGLRTAQAAHERRRRLILYSLSQPR